MIPRPGLPFLLALALLPFAGCLEAAPTEDPSTMSAGDDAVGMAAAAPVPPVALEGEAWLPPSQGQDRMETLVEFATGDGFAGTVALRLGARYGVETPPLLADVVVEVRDPAGDVLETAHLSLDSPEAELALDGLAAGPHALALLSYGGSGGGYGDYVWYSIELA
jgi:hypothetical protein